MGGNGSVAFADECHLLQVGCIVADVEPVEAGRAVGGVVEFHPTSEVEGWVEEHVEVGLLYFVDDDGVGCCLVGLDSDDAASGDVGVVGGCRRDSGDAGVASCDESALIHGGCVFIATREGDAAEGGIVGLDGGSELQLLALCHRGLGLVECDACDLDFNSVDKQADIVERQPVCR